MPTAKTNNYRFIGWGLLLIILISGFFIARYENLNLFFLSVLLSEIVLVIIYSRRFNESQIAIVRIILGCLFVYSGIVKGIDPVGTQYRIMDYFIVFETDWAVPLALPLSVVMNAAEFILGILLVFNVNMKITSWLVMLMMAVFTVVTINDAIYNPVPNCGCFGDALIISNWQTFYKNLIIDSLILIVFLSRNRTGRWFKAKAEWAILLIFFLIFTGFEIYNIRHLPVIDFRQWKIGNTMANKNPLPLKYYLSYRNKETGEVKEYLSPDYPYNDSVWNATWEFIRQRVVDPNPVIHDLKIEDENGNDFTPDIIENPDYQFILVAYDLSLTNLSKINEIKDFISKCNTNGISFAILTSSIPDDVRQFKETYGIDAEFYYADDVSLMIMIRSNPGLLLLKEAVVIDKWHYNDFPTFGEVFK
ncbi:MAG: hypothetical protein B6D61_00915 [Bacteroidetes bacterium 4484_249]|nr:MAG: hypothetical protein B6D61_00915 [Bacteroidetes bacterium 4484_249]